jgi:hypothetical protein
MDVTAAAICYPLLLTTHVSMSVCLLLCSPLYRPCVRLCLLTTHVPMSACTAVAVTNCTAVCQLTCVLQALCEALSAAKAQASRLQGELGRLQSRAEAAERQTAALEQELSGREVGRGCWWGGVTRQPSRVLSVCYCLQVCVLVAGGWWHCCQCRDCGCSATTPLALLLHDGAVGAATSLLPVPPATSLPLQLLLPHSPCTRPCGPRNSTAAVC